MPPTTHSPPTDHVTTPTLRVTDRKTSALSVKETDDQTGDVTDYVNLEKLPEFQILNARVSQ